MSDPFQSGSRAETDRQTLSDAARREGQSIRDTAAQAGETLRREGASLGDSVRERASARVEDGKVAAASGLSDFTAAIRKASEELGARDQSMAAGLARQAASGLEQAAEAIEGRSVQDITRSVADFARRQPGAFLIGAALAGVALGRFARASSDHAGPLGSNAGHGARSGDDWRHDDGRSRFQGNSSGAGAASSFGDRSGRHEMGSASDSALNRAGASGSTATGGLTSTPTAASSSQADATGYRAPQDAPQTSALSQPGVSGSTNTAGLVKSSNPGTGERP